MVNGQYPTVSWIQQHAQQSASKATTIIMLEYQKQ